MAGQAAPKQELLDALVSAAAAAAATAAGGAGGQEVGGAGALAAAARRASRGRRCGRQPGATRPAPRLPATQLRCAP